MFLCLKENLLLSCQSELYYYSLFMFRHCLLGWKQHFQGSHFSGDTKFHVFSRLFPGKAMKSQVNLTLNQLVFMLIMWIWQRGKSSFLCKWHLEKWILKHLFSKFQVFFRFGVKIPGFSYVLNKFHAFSRPGKVKTKFKVFQVGWEPWFCFSPVKHADFIGSVDVRSAIFYTHIIIYTILMMLTSCSPYRYTIYHDIPYYFVRIPTYIEWTLHAVCCDFILVFRGHP